MSLEQKCSELKKDVVQFAEEVRRSGFVKAWHSKAVTDGGVLTKRFAKGTGTNDPPVPSIDGVRDAITERFAESLSRGNKVVRNDLLNDEIFVAGLARIITNEPGTGHDLLTAIEEEGRSHPTHNAGVDTQAATVEDFKANLARPMTGDFGRAKEVMHYGKLLAQGYQLRSPVGISEGQSFFAFAIKKSDAQENEWSIRKAAHLGGRMEPEKVKLGRRMSQSEIHR